jgi:hypothetical protein
MTNPLCSFDGGISQTETETISKDCFVFINFYRLEIEFIVRFRQAEHHCQQALAHHVGGLAICAQQ